MTSSIATIRTEGLGDSTYVLVREGIAIVVDPQRDIDRFEQVLTEAGAEPRLVLETHLHNDYVSGGRDLARKTGAELVMPAGAAPAFRHRPAFHHEDLDLGQMVVRPIHTPGHTPEHTSYLVLIDGQELAVFTGGSLLVGSAGRTDLLGDERAESLARLQYGSVNRLAALPETVGLYPTHGAGSFCTTSGAGSVVSDVGSEKRTNPVLQYEDEDAFVVGQLSDLVPYPSYYRHMGPINLTGAPEPDLSVPEIDTVPPGVTVVDARPSERFAAGHRPGALGVQLRDSFGTWVGWLTEHDTPLALVLDDDQDTDEAMRQLARIGYDDVRGVLRSPNGGPLASFRTVGPEEFAAAARSGAQILDVRAPNEWEEGTIDGSLLTHLPDLARQTPEGLEATSPVWVVCGSGYRASTAAGILLDRGFEPIVLAEGGATDVLAVTSKTA
ncbi:MAG TPA: MBL fold metallo-hydrolase [Acidimicrobiia bacterium]|nr:MBL fold metallo-hydrolase [Acidimicrobiia bacterium]